MQYPEHGCFVCVLLKLTDVVSSPFFTALQTAELSKGRLLTQVCPVCVYVCTCMYEGMHKCVRLCACVNVVVFEMCVYRCCPLAQSAGHRVIVKGVGGFSCTHYNLPTHSVVQRARSRDMAGVSGPLAAGKGREGKGREGKEGLTLDSVLQCILY